MPVTYIGRPLRRLEDPRFLRGEGQYTDDFARPDQAFAAFVRAPHAHARIISIRVDQAARAPGVLMVLTGQDYLDDGCQGIRHAPVPADSVDYQRPAFSRALDESHLPMATDKVRYPGEAVAVVIAETPQAAKDAAQLVDVAYAPLEAVSDVRAASTPGAPNLWPSAPDNIAVTATFGDAQATRNSIERSEVIVEHEFRIQRIANAQLEPRAAIGTFDPSTETYTMIAGSQGVVRQRASLAAALNMPLGLVHVICPDVGGGFGPRTALYPEQVVVTWAARYVGRPVRWTSDRTEAFLTDFQGRDAEASARLGLTRDGRITALDVSLTFNVGAHTGSYVPLSNAARIMTSVYAIPAACVRTRAVLTNTVPTGPYRGAGRPEATFILERMLDLAAQATGLDRVEIRRRNLIQRDQLPYQSAMGLTYDSGDFADNMQRVLDMADWRNFPARRAAALEQNRRAGISIANYIEAPVGAPHERVQISVEPQGVVEVVVGTQSSGQGHATAFAQVVAEHLQVPPHSVRLVSGDTARVTAGGGTHSDRSMRLVGSLLVEACAAIRDQAREFDPESQLSVFDVAQRTRLVAEASFTGRIPAHPTGAAVCEVEVDPETGEIRILRYTCVDDVGQPINPLILEGQVHGGIVQGLGQALSEGVVVDAASAQVHTASFLDYALPRAAGLPDFETLLVEDPTPGNPLRIKGGGESGITPSLAVVVNAVLDALRPLGVTDVDMPLSPARVWEAIARAAPRGQSAPGHTPPGPGY